MLSPWIGDLRLLAERLRPHLKEPSFPPVQIHSQSKQKCRFRAMSAGFEKILAGVNLGGFDSYRAWDRSTYFEFDSDPTRSGAFSVSRVVDHPFKSTDPVKYSDDPRQVILRFEDTHFNLTVDCVTCKEKRILEWSEDPRDVSAELRSVNMEKRPEALIRQELWLGQTQPIWLPPRRDHAAPHLLVDGADKHHLIWMSRTNVENTISCM